MKTKTALSRDEQAALREATSFVAELRTASDFDVAIVRRTAADPLRALEE
jgi:hypothetical protein